MPVLHPGAGYVIFSQALLSLFLWRTARQERRAVFTASGLFCLCIAVLALSRPLTEWGLSVAGGYLRSFSIFGEGMCLISTVGIAVFRVGLPAFRVRSPRILQDVVVGVSGFIWILIWLRVNKVDLTSIIATSAVVTAVIGFSLQDTLGNILGGIAIQVDQSIQVGDWIRVNDFTGRVVEIRWRHTSIETRNWETVVIPNSVLVKNNFLVLGKRTGQPLQLRSWIYFNVDFRVNPPQVIRAVETALRSAAIPNVARDPEPQCLFFDFSESTGRYAVRYWLTDLASDSRTDSEVRQHVFFALRRAGISPSIPAHAIFVTEETDERKAGKEQKAVQRREAALGRVELFHSLEPEELRRLAERLVPAPFASDDVMTRQGATAHWLYILVDGWADVMVHNEEGGSTRVAELGPGSFFGEMGLMTGEPRTASVIARTEVDCYRLDKEAFQDIIRSRPRLAEEISHLLAQRRTELDAVRENLDAEAQARRLSKTENDILARIRRFFELNSSRTPVGAQRGERF